mmetsp:Transcript_23320/g.54161  ORF Transcript_23320/g.54161 Transcript_23320/m.54161 type:complete len:85 (+) Transcript_23320:108-362(+)
MGASQRQSNAENESRSRRMDAMKMYEWRERIFFLCMDLIFFSGRHQVGKGVKTNFTMMVGLDKLKEFHYLCYGCVNSHIFQSDM